MKKVKLSIGISLLVLSVPVILISCKKPQAKTTASETLDAPNLPASTYNYASKHGVDNSLATLGRVLFYDRNLSGNTAISCGSCHKQESAFADNVRFNKGANGVALKRNSPSIQGIKGFSVNVSVVNQQVVSDGSKPNDSNQQKVLLFWDGRQNSLSDMVLNPVLNHNEMNMPDFATLVNRLGNLPYYPALFNSAFGDPAITKERIAYALEGFLSCLNTTVDDPNPNTIVTLVDNQGNIITESGNTNNNSFNPNAPVPTSFLTLEDQGRFLFHSKYNCAQCHDPSNIGTYGSVSSPSQMFNIGLDENYADNGLGAITHQPGDQGVFKVPTLKNISLTAPYMHDGRFTDLSQVLDHYSHGIKNNANLSSKFLNTDGTPKALDILPAEKKALIAFLNSLTDEDFLTSPMYSDPFKK